MSSSSGSPCLYFWLRQRRLDWRALGRTIGLLLPALVVFAALATLPEVLPPTPYSQPMGFAYTLDRRMEGDGWLWFGSAFAMSLGVWWPLAVASLRVDRFGCPGGCSRAAYLVLIGWDWGRYAMYAFPVVMVARRLDDPASGATARCCWRWSRRRPSSPGRLRRGAAVARRPRTLAADQPAADPGHHRRPGGGGRDRATSGSGLDPPPEPMAGSLEGVTTRSAGGAVVGGWWSWSPAPSPWLPPGRAPADQLGHPVDVLLVAGEVAGASSLGALYSASACRRSSCTLAFLDGVGVGGWPPVGAAAPARRR